jgi:3-isopropylmalate/(R)-2-methylmalate dehydratase small subunit
MKPVRIVQGRCVPLERSDVDTDQIIPSDWLKRVERTGFGRGLFSEWRDDPDFVLNQQNYVGATILLAGPRFGTGSSREHAVWALMDYGFEAIIAPSFGDIFRNNSSKQGLVIVELPVVDVDELVGIVKVDPTRLVVIDVDQLRVEVPETGWQRTFTLDPITRDRLLNGWTTLALHFVELTPSAPTKQRASRRL